MEARVAERVTITVPLDAPGMTEAEFHEAVEAMGGTLIHSGTDFAALYVTARTADQARRGFVDEMHRLLGDDPGLELIWRWKPIVGTRRTLSGPEYVASARYTLIRF